MTENSPDTPPEIVITENLWTSDVVTYNIATGQPQNNTPSGVVTEAHALIGHLFHSTGNNVIWTSAFLTSAQQGVLGDIVDYGLSHGYSQAEVAIAANQASYESSFSQSAVNGSHVGLYQYDPSTWAYLGHSNLNINSESDQIAAMYQDITTFEARYQSGETSGQIPSTLSFADYMEIKHHAGPNYTDFTGVVAVGYVNGYEHTASILGFHVS